MVGSFCGQIPRNSTAPGKVLQQPTFPEDEGVGEAGLLSRSKLGYAAARYPLLVLLRTGPYPENRNDTTNGIQG
jgi:hypothetical protein